MSFSFFDFHLLIFCILKRFFYKALQFDCKDNKIYNILPNKKGNNENSAILCIVKTAPKLYDLAKS